MLSSEEEKWGELPMKLPQEGVTPLIWAYCHEHDVVAAHLKALALPTTSMSSRRSCRICVWYLRETALF